MSRTIDMEKPETWDEDDVAYLRDRDRLPADFVDADAEEEAEGYEAMNKKALRAEVKSRGLEVDEEAKKADLIAALEEDDGSK